mmetsp:Transcript_113572/g.315986  ORF Transcript_113572/g.315986 Transcript_113572/m.315986 type:complete len:225 (-) Transcript_113572:148-822(-)
MPSIGVTAPNCPVTREACTSTCAPSATCSAPCAAIACTSAFQSPPATRRPTSTSGGRNRLASEDSTRRPTSTFPPPRPSPAAASPAGCLRLPWPFVRSWGTWTETSQIGLSTSRAVANLRDFLFSATCMASTSSKGCLERMPVMAAHFPGTRDGSVNVHDQACCWHTSRNSSRKSSETSCKNMTSAGAPSRRPCANMCIAVSTTSLRCAARTAGEDIAPIRMLF